MLHLFLSCGKNRNISLNIIALMGNNIQYRLEKLKERIYNIE